jgi:hypothetical protein
MPVGLPPLGGAIGRSRMRISASAYVTWLRCPRRWFIGSKIGLREPVNPRMVMGIVVEDALVGLMMESPLGQHLPGRSRWAAWLEDDVEGLLDSPKPESLEGLKEWISAKVADSAAKVIEIGAQRWDETPTKTSDYTWADIEQKEIELMLHGGLELFLEEVESCYEAGGGKLLEQWRQTGDPHRVPAPRWDDKPCFPVPSKVQSLVLANEEEEENISALPGSGDISWAEAWEVARPWIKDPRVWQPQRLYHPEGWSAGEMDLVLRWRGKTTIVDIKASDGTGKYASGLEPQLLFYRFLWASTRGVGDLDASQENSEGDEVEALQGWYLKGPIRKEFEPMSEKELPEFSEELHTIWKEMTAADSEPENWPVCSCGNCDDIAESEKSSHIKIYGNEVEMPSRWADLSLAEIKEKMQPRTPAKPLDQIQNRINVVGKLSGKWGPLSNHFGEQVHGALLQTGGQSHAVLEEMSAGSFPDLRTTADGDYLIRNAAPGLWRSKVRLYLDGSSEIISGEEVDETIETTRLGLIQSKANIDGLVVGRAMRSGQRLGGKPWTMFSAHLWDGRRVIEIVAFGRSIVSTLAELEIGDRVLISSAELGWRAGLPQLRINPRITRMEVIARDWQPTSGHPSENQ